VALLGSQSHWHFLVATAPGRWGVAFADHGGELLTGMVGLTPELRTQPSRGCVTIVAMCMGDDGLSAAS
jgi:hypothetical protein